MKELARASSSHVACTNSPYEVNDDLKKKKKKNWQELHEVFCW